ncbi:hypothetical protein [Candidatus Phytoplasma fraxini]
MWLWFQWLITFVKKWLLVLFVSLLTFIKDWFHGFTIAEILNRRFDFIATNILITSFLIGFKPILIGLTNILLSPFHVINLIFQKFRSKKLNNKEKEYIQLIVQEVYHHQREKDNKTLKSNLIELKEREETEENE